MQLEGIFNHINAGILLVDADLNVVFANQWMHVYHRSDIPTGASLREVFRLSDKEQNKLERKVHSVLKLKVPSFLSAEHDHYLLPMQNSRLFNPMFKLMQQEVSMVPYGEQGDLVLIMIYDQTALMVSQNEIKEKSRSLSDSLSALQQAHQKLEEQTAIIEYKTNYDSLTGLPNRTLLKDRVINMMNSARLEAYEFALIYIDINRFGPVNDSFGSEFGDELLCQIAKRLKKLMLPADTLARLASDEFVIVKSKFEHLDSLVNFCESLLQEIERPIQLRHQALVMSASIGVSLFPSDANSYEDLLISADLAMKQAKISQQGAYSFYTEGLNAELKELMVLETELKNAIAGQLFEVYYQPKFRVNPASPQRAEIYGAEALVRWFHPTLGRVTPDEFIPVAERMDLITDITLLVFEQTMQLMQRLRNEGCDLVVSINISPKDLVHAYFCESLWELTQRYLVAPALIEIEITERMAVMGSECLGLLDQLREFGFSLSMDDFGTGYSSLSYLAQLPMDILKIDKSFVDQLGKSEKQDKFLKHIIDLAKVFEMRTIAEGVEDLETVKRLVEMDCLMFQGYYFSRPLPVGQFIEFCQNHKVLDWLSEDD